MTGIFACLLATYKGQKLLAKLYFSLPHLVPSPSLVDWQAARGFTTSLSGSIISQRRSERWVESLGHRRNIKHWILRHCLGEGGGLCCRRNCPMRSYHPCPAFSFFFAGGRYQSRGPICQDLPRTNINIACRTTHFGSWPLPCVSVKGKNKRADVVFASYSAISGFEIVFE